MEILECLRICVSKTIDKAIGYKIENGPKAIEISNQRETCRLDEIYGNSSLQRHRLDEYTNQFHLQFHLQAHSNGQSLYSHFRRFPDTAGLIISFRVDSDILSLDGKEPLPTKTEVGDDGKLHVTVRKSMTVGDFFSAEINDGLPSSSLNSSPAPRNKIAEKKEEFPVVSTPVFVFVCVFGVWMLTSISLVSPRKKSTIQKAASLLDSVFENPHRKTNLPRKIPNRTATVFEDNPGDLPSDAIKYDDDLMDQTRSASMEAEHEREITKSVVDGVER
ncbi:hypothetical protein L2E82_16902 [Cichorium intybus]|uniref:Uncharacterized protein n=1 Tax=Cichorium intybus TaxID=13427 RepID=A0ACB9F856_CICIN|nr:hypothetical protein L2E82_16902 [Cichorium intybus]